MQNVSDYIDDKALHMIVLAKVKVLLEKNQSDVKIISLILCFYEKILLRLERTHLLEQVIPTLLSMRLSDPDIINRVVSKYPHTYFTFLLFCFPLQVVSLVAYGYATPDTSTRTITHSVSFKAIVLVALLSSVALQSELIFFTVVRSEI